VGGPLGHWLEVGFWAAVAFDSTVLLILVHIRRRLQKRRK
jgi:hypothetical protein